MKLPSGVAPLVLLALALCGPLPTVAALSQKDVCALCHSEVRPQDDLPCSHADLECVDCHAALGDWDPAQESEHAEKLPPVNCSTCHREQSGLVAHSAHRAASPADARPYPRCVTCHGIPHFQPLAQSVAPLERKRAIDEACTNCHEKDVAALGESKHHAALARDGSGPSCVDCHAAHDIRKPADPAAAMNIDLASPRCEGCHVQARASLHHAAGAAAPNLSCLVCHAGHSSGAAATQARVVSEGGANKCLLCHASGQIIGFGPHASISAPDGAALDCTRCHTFHWLVDGQGGAAPRRATSTCTGCHADQEEQVAASVHGAAKASCEHCHATPAAGAAATPSKCREGVPRAVNCATCHAAAAGEWQRSPHGGDPGNGHAAARCSDCHGAHDVRRASDPQSTVYPLNLPNTCESCHHTDPSPEHPAPGGDKVGQYETSVHGRGLRVEGLVVTATCASCHGSHDIRKPGDPDAPTSRRSIPHTCGACHAGVLATYLEGVHGKAFESGVADVPVCNDCHREHAIQDPAMAGSSVSSALVAETCARCHADDALGRRYGLKSSVRRSWGSSYHGIASAFGAAGAANCASCHGFHAIFPSQDPRSSVNVANLDATCGNCHLGATAAFARVPVHSVVEDKSNPVPYWVKTIYTALVLIVIGAFVLFILLDLFGRLRIRLGWGPSETEYIAAHEWPDEDALVAPTETFRRMGPHLRLQHAVLISSFMLLVVTGIPVFLYESNWMRSVIDLEGGFLLRSRLHRVGALGLIGLSVWHLCSVALLPAARNWFRLMMFRPRDISDFAQEMLFDLGLMDWLARRRAFAPLFARFPWLRCDRRPCMGRFGLIEKLEYGAVGWGNFVMILTGVILWRPDWFLDWTPAWTFEVCRVVHGFEATLAFLAIIIWHMYHVHLRPGVFPMSRVWLNGKISRSELRHHHPREYLDILEQRRSAARALARAQDSP